MVYADYDFYTGTYDGDAVPRARFARVALRATEMLDADTCGRAAGVFADGDPVVAVQLALCCCALVELLDAAASQGPDSGALVKESVGSWTRTYAATSGEAVLRARIADAEQRYLGHTGLLYRGRQSHVS